MLSKKTIMLSLILVIFSSLIALNSTNKENIQNTNQTTSEVDALKPKLSFQTYSELWIDNSIYIYFFFAFIT